MRLERILLLGGNGCLGTALACRLAKRGLSIRLPVRRLDRARHLLLLPRIEARVADIHDPQTLVSLMQGVDAVVNLVGILHDRDTAKPYGKRFAAAHVVLVEKIIAAMRQTGVRRLVQVSALGAAADAPSGYLRSKAAGEAVVFGAAPELDVTVFRPSLVLAPGNALLKTLTCLLERLPIVPLAGGAMRVQPVHAGDVADVLCDCLDRPASFGQFYELCGSRICRLDELVCDFARLLGRPVPVVVLPGALACLLAAVLGWLPNPPLSRDNLRSMQRDSVGSGRHNYPGWQPQGLEAALADCLTGGLARRFDAYRRRAGR